MIKVGDRVVCVVDLPGIPPKGSEWIVQGIQDPCCGPLLNIGIPGTNPGGLCPACREYVARLDFTLYDFNYFRKVEPRHISVTVDKEIVELLEEPVNEVLDVQKIEV